MKKRIVILLISVFLLMSILLTSCELDESGTDGNETGKTTEAVTGTGTEYTPSDVDSTTGDSPADSETTSGTIGDGGTPFEPVDLIGEWLPEISYANDGVASTVVFLTHGNYADEYMLFPDQKRNTLLSDAAYARTSKIKNDFGVTFENNSFTDCFGQLASAMYASVCWIDIAYPSSEDAILMLENALLSDLEGYENIHLEQPWWNQSSVEAFTLDGHVYFAASEYSAMGQSAVGILYNRELYRSFGGEDLADLVERGDWTLEMMMEIMAENGTMGHEYDLGSMIFQREHTDAFYWALGGRILSDNGNGRYEIAIENIAIDQIARQVYDLLYEDHYHGYLMDEHKGDFAQSEAWSAFTYGYPLFMTFDFGTQFALLEELEFDAGYLPLPKFEKAQADYYTLCAPAF